MNHYIQFDGEGKTWALFRLFEGKRFKITDLSEDDLDTIYIEYKLYRKNKEMGQKVLSTLILQEENTLAYIHEYFITTEIGKKFEEEAIVRICYLKSLIINSEGEPENDTDRINVETDGIGVVSNEGRTILEDTGEEEGTGRQADGLYP